VFVFQEFLPGGARMAFTGRGPGVGQPPYTGLNLGGHVGDDPASVRANRAALAAELELVPDRLAFMDQVHGDVVVQVDDDWRGARPGEPGPACDALVTTRRDVALAVLVADCVPVLLAAPAEGVAGVAHAGRKGMAAGVTLRLVEAMRDLGARTIVGRVGPSVCPRCYPVPQELREEVATQWPVARSVSWHGQPSLDVSAGVLEQLAPHSQDVAQVPGCTVERTDLYSYRRDGVTGRFAGVVRLVEDAAPGARRERG
jgi:polyphenol oxidase